MPPFTKRVSVWDDAKTPLATSATTPTAIAPAPTSVHVPHAGHLYGPSPTGGGDHTTSRSARHSMSGPHRSRSHVATRTRDASAAFVAAIHLGHRTPVASTPSPFGRARLRS